MIGPHLLRATAVLLLAAAPGWCLADRDSAPTTGAAPPTQESQGPGQGQGQTPDAEALRTREAKHLASMELGLVSIPKVQEYLNQLLARIQAAGPQPAVPARVLIRAKLSYNAATTPAGHIVIDLGWLKSLDSEAELAALIAHEYGHVVRDHLGLKNRLGATTHVAGVLGRAIGLATKSNNALSLKVAVSSWSDVLLPRWNRDQEFEADDMALQITQAMGYAFVPSVRAFLERVQSVEQQTTVPAGARKDGQPMLTDDHPPIQDRIARAQEAMRGRPRQRPSEGADGWLAVRNSEEFRAAEKEYILAIRVQDILKSGRHNELKSVLPEIAQLPLPPKSAAALTMMASIEPDPKRRLVWLEKAIELPDTAFMAYGILATTQRDGLGQYAAAIETLEAGLERFDTPRQLWPDVIEFQRITSERLDAVPKDRQTMEMALFMMKLRIKTTSLLAACTLNAEFAQACNLSAQNAQERRAAEAAQKAAEDALARKATQKIESLFKKR